MWLLLKILFMILQLPCGYSYTKTIWDYEIYGTKVAANNQFALSADNFITSWIFLFNSTHGSSYCTFAYSNTMCDFVYSIIVPVENGTTVVYNCVDINEKHVIGVFSANTSCQFQTIDQKVFSNYSTQDNVVIATDQDTAGVYGFADDFVFFYELQSPFRLNIWPNTYNISPRAIDIGLNVDYGVVVGYRQWQPTTAMEYGLIIRLHRNQSNPTIHAEISMESALNFSFSDPRATHFIGQSRQYSSRTILSVSIAWATRRLLIGVPSLNMVLLYAFDNVSQPLATRENGVGFSGYGKSVAWLDSAGNYAVILANTYVYSSDQWISSCVDMYDIRRYGFSDETPPIFIYPNSQQKLLSDLNTVLIRLVCSVSRNLIIYDTLGNIGIIFSAPAGSYADTSLNPDFSISAPCLPGTFRNYSGIDLCIPCPPGTFSSSCQQCSSNDSFCPYGSIEDLPYSSFESIEQEQEYPESPESTVFDDILMQNMFGLHWRSSHCTIVSPLIWVLVVVIIGILLALVLVIMGIRYENFRRRHEQVKNTLKMIDLIGDGELWIGGLVSAGIVVLIVSAGIFASAFYWRYPIEDIPENSSFACDPTLRNIKFTTSLQKMPQSDHSKTGNQRLFDLLNAQQFSLNIDLIQTAFTCQHSLTVSRVINYVMVPLSITSCVKTHNGSILSLSVALPVQEINVQLVLPGLRSVGAIRVGLSGPANSSDNGRYQLRELKCASTYTPPTINQVLAVSSLFTLQLTPIVNKTAALSDHDVTKYSGIWSPSYIVKTGETFSTENRYTYYKRAKTNVNITIEKKVYYVSNVQEPIARQTEIVFRMFSFVIVALEVFHLIFLIFKLLVAPPARKIWERMKMYIVKHNNEIQISDNSYGRNENKPSSEATKEK